MSLHVAVLFEFPTLSGGERSMLSVLGALLGRSDIRFTALAPPTGMLADKLKELGVPLIPFRTREVAEPKATAVDNGPVRHRPDALRAALGDCCRNLGADILHANSLAMCRLTGPLERSTFCRTGHLRDIVRLSMSAIRDINANDGLVAVSHATRTYHVQQGLDPDRTCVIHNGADAKILKRNASPGPDQVFNWRQRLGIPEDAFLVLSVGQICLRKGQVDLAEAIVGLQSAEPARRLHLIIAGERYSTKPESIRYEQQVVRSFRDMGLEHQLHRPGYVADVGPLMRQSDVLIHAARQEPFGRVLLEAAACGLPIIATSVGGTSELLRPGIDALLVQPQKPAEIAAALCGVMDDRESARQRASTAHYRVAAEFTVARAAANLAGFWRSCHKPTR